MSAGNGIGSAISALLGRWFGRPAPRGDNNLFEDGELSGQPLLPPGRQTELREQYETKIVADRLHQAIGKGDYDGALEIFAELLTPEERELGIEPLRRSPASIPDAARYYSILIQTLSGRADEAFEEARKLGTHPTPDVEFLSYVDLRRQAADLRMQIRASVERAGWRPAVLINSMPRSASSYVSSIMSTMLDVPIGRLTLGGHPRRVLVEPWARAFLQGNCVTHDHFVPSAATVDALTRAGATDMFFQFRDPRETAWSALQQLGPGAEKPAFVAHVQQEISFMVGWLEIIEGNPPFRVHLVDYRQVRGDPIAAFTGMFEAMGLPLRIEDLAGCLDGAHSNLHNYNFRRGDSNEWRRELPADVVEKADAIVPAYVRQFLDQTALEAG